MLGWTKCTERPSPSKGISDPFPLSAELLLYSPYLRVLLLRREPLTTLLSSSISSCSCCLTSSGGQDPGQWFSQSRSSLLPPGWPSRCPETSGHIRLPNIDSPFHFHFFPLISKTRALLGVGGVVTRTAAVQGSGLSLAMITLLLYGSLFLEN